MKINHVLQAQLLIKIPHVHFLVFIEHPVIFFKLPQKVVVGCNLRWLQLGMDLKSIKLPLQLIESLLSFLGA